jgi:hypothetical protein
VHPGPDLGTELFELHDPVLPRPELKPQLLPPGHLTARVAKPPIDDFEE